MARLKRDHSGWNSSGLYQKYQQPKIDEMVLKVKNKKDTKKWCRGKIGVKHDLQRHFHYTTWFNKRTNFIRVECINCGRKSHTKDTSIPLRIDLDEYDGVSYPVQVKVNGKPIPFTYCQLQSLDLRKWHYCEYCKDWH